MKIPHKFIITVTRSELVLGALVLFLFIISLGLWFELNQERTRSVLSKPVLIPMPHIPTNNDFP